MPGAEPGGEREMPATADAPLCAAPDPRTRPPRHTVPALACDAHMHICGPESRYAYSPRRIYTPPDALLTQYLELAGVLGIGRVVLVQPSVYGTDNSAMLDAMRACPLPCRGVAVLADDVGDEALDALHADGVRGVRLNLVDTRERSGALPVAAVRRTAARIARLGWHVELLLHVDAYPDLDAQLADLPVELVLGHLGYSRPGASSDDPGFRALLRLLAAEKAWVKLTGPYRLTRENLPYAPVRPLAEALLDTAPGRLVWGSDWPHVMVTSKMPNDGELLGLLRDWAGDDRLAARILVDNAAELYDF